MIDLKRADKLAVGIIAVLAVYFVVHRSGQVHPKPKSFDTPAAQSEPSAVPFAVSTPKGTAVGDLFFSHEGDSCQVTDVIKSDRPKGYGPGYSVTEVHLLCSTKQSKHYTLKNFGIYKAGQLVSFTRRKIPDGGCRLLSSRRVPLSHRKKTEFVVAMFSCRKNGNEIWQEVSTYYQSGKLVSSRVQQRNPAALRAAAAVARVEKKPNPAELGGH